MSKRSDVVIRFEDLTMSTMCDGQIEKRFQQAIQEIVETFRDAEDHPDLYKGKDEWVGKIRIDIDISRSVGGSVEVSADCRHELPRKKRVRRAAVVRGSRLVVEPPDAEQTPLKFNRAEAPTEQE